MSWCRRLFTLQSLLPYWSVCSKKVVPEISMYTCIIVIFIFTNLWLHIEWDRAGYFLPDPSQDVSHNLPSQRHSKSCWTGLCPILHLSQVLQKSFGLFELEIDPLSFKPRWNKFSFTLQLGLHLLLSTKLWASVDRAIYGSPFSLSLYLIYYAQSPVEPCYPLDHVFGPVLTFLTGFPEKHFWVWNPSLSFEPRRMILSTACLRLTHHVHCSCYKFFLS